jgi:hypothetical protein
LVSWTPTEAQGPGPYPVTVRVTDNGTPSLGTNQSFQITVNEVNVTPTLVAPLDININEQVAWTYQLSASDPDQPANTLTCSLVSGPTGLTVSPAGLLSWTPTEAQGPGPYPVTVRVADNGTPPLSATTSFNITVFAPIRVDVTSVSAGSVTLTWGAIDGHRYRVQFKDHLGAAAWTDLPGDPTGAGGIASKTDDTLGVAAERFYRIRALP